MPNYRRAFVPGGTFFFTVVTYNRYPLFDDVTAVRLLGQAIREEQQSHPFTIDAIVLLPDHLHTIWTLPHGDSNYSARIGRIKTAFSSKWRDAGGIEQQVTAAEEREGRAGIWQKRFWEHTCEDVEDFDTRFDYIHFNPVKHGYVECPVDWPHSSFRRWVQKGVLDNRWACGGRGVLDFKTIEDECGEP